MGAVRVQRAAEWGGTTPSTRAGLISRFTSARKPAKVAGAFYQSQPWPGGTE